MLLTGTFRRSIDEKLRIAIPKRFRDCFPAGDESNLDALYVAPGTDGSISLFTEESFQHLAHQLDGASPTGRHVRAFSRLFFSRAECVDLDKQGRIRIPTDLAELAGLREEAILIGVRDRIEIWNVVRWQEYVEENGKEYDELAEKAMSNTQ